MSGQPSWPPFRPPKDCSQGFCSIYCPEWCYFLFPPPPGDTPFDTPGDVVPGSHSDNGPTTLSPAVIVIITLVAAALLLGGYYAVVCRYRQRRRQPASAPTAVEGTVVRHPTPPDGLDESLINKITVCKYRRDVGLVGGTNCSVCLSEFREEESLRLLPKCSHAFHVQCIDTWLKSHPNCPLCRAGIIWASPPLGLPAPPESEGDQPVAGSEDLDEVAIALQDSETSLGTNEDVTKFPSEEPDDGREPGARYDVIEVGDNGVQPIRRSFSMGSSHRIENLEGSLVSEGMSSSMARSSPPVARSLSWARSSSIDHGGALPV